MSSETSQSSLMDFTVPAVKKLPSSTSLATKLTNGVAEFITRDLRPVSVVDGVGFLHLMELAEPRYSIPCRRTMMGVIDSKYVEAKRCIHGLVSQQDHLSLTIDMWTSRAGDGYYSLTAHFMSPSFSMEHKTLQCHNMPGTRDHTHIAEAIETCSRDWCFDINKCVTAFTTDNASNITKAIREDLSSLHMPCAGHTLNLSVQNGLSVNAIQTVLARSRKIVIHFNQSRLHKEELHAKQEILGLPKHNLVQVNRV